MSVSLERLRLVFDTLPDAAIETITIAEYRDFLKIS